MGKKRLTLHDLFYNNKFVLVFSVIVAFFLWVVISMTVGTEITKTIENVPVIIDLKNSVPEQSNLQNFDTKTYFVDVKVRGKRYIVGSLGADDINVSAQTNYVDSVGKHTLKLVAKPSDESLNYEILELSQNDIEMYFDVYKEATFTLQSDINIDRLITEGYISEKPVLSTTSVLISGPATEVNKITSVIAKVNFDVEKLTSSTTVVAEIIPKNEYGGNMSYLTINGGKDVTVTVPVKKLKTVPVTVDFYDMPADYINNPLDITISPATVKIAAEESYVDSLTKIAVGTIDIHKVGATRNKFTFDAKLSDVTIQDDIKSFTVIVDARNLSSASFDIPKENISFKNIPEGYDVKLTQSSINGVKIVGPTASLSQLGSSSIFADVDFSEIENFNENTKKVQVKVRIKDNTNSWAYGTYEVGISVTKK
ncbi:MAG: hypothetical protein K5917_06950 [Clostridiales bacterium]|nr:hypothetical protein [Clostridiales bacterium]